MGGFLRSRALIIVLVYFGNVKIPPLKHSRNQDPFPRAGQLGPKAQEQDPMLGEDSEAMFAYVRWDGIHQTDGESETPRKLSK